jgi:PAS domain S-box-containing protein
MNVRRLIADHGAVAWPLVVAIATTLGSAFGDIVTFPQTGSAILYPPYAVLAAALLLAPRRRWWMFLAASFVGHIVLGFTTSYGAPPGFIACTELANQSRALVAALAWQRFHGGRPRLDTLEEMAVFLLVAGILGPAVGATIGAATVIWYGRAATNAGGYSGLWQAWFFSNAIVGITLLPFILVTARVVVDAHDSKVSGQPRRAREFAAATLGMAIASWLALLSGNREVPVRLSAPLPFVLWAAVRFGTLFTAAALVVVSGCAIAGAMNGAGPLTATSSDNGVLSLYLYLAFIALPCLLVAALVEEREAVFGTMRDTQHRYQLATTAGAVVVWDWHLDSNQVSVDPGLKTALGYADDDIPDWLNDWVRHVHPDDAPRMREQLRAYLEHRAPTFDVEFRMLCKDGSARWFFSRGVAIRRSNGVPTRLIGTNIDITDRKKARRALREGEERMALAAAAANLGFWAWSDGTPLWLSENARRIVGLDADELPADDDIANLVHREDRERLHESRVAALTQQGGMEEEFRVVRRDGQIRWLNVTGRVQIEADGVARHLTGVIMDITERREASVELAATRRELAHLARVATLGQLSGAMAHELRQPLAAIMFNARAAQRLMKKDTPNLDEVREILDDIAVDDLRANAVIARLRALLRKDEVAFEQLDVNDVVAQSLDVVRGDLQQRGVVLSRRFSSQLRPVFGDRVELQQVFVNLLMNAAEAMSAQPQASRRLTVYTQSDDAGDGLAPVVISVADCGTGIHDADMSQVFEPFVTTKPEGLGLGLSICRTIVSAHEGQLWAENNSDGGATFYVALPARPRSAGGVGVADQAFGIRARDRATSAS